MLARFGQSWARLAVAGLLAAALSGCGKPTKTYPMAQSAAWAALMGTTIPGMAFGERAHGMPGSGTPGRVVWAIEAGPDEAAQTGEPATPQVIMRLSATLTPVAYGTAVSVDIEPAGGDDPARIDALDRQFPAIARLWRAIAGEQVDAVLTQRPFDMLNIRSAMASAAMSQLSQIGKQMNEAAKEVQRREEETIDRAYALDKHGD